MDRIGISFSNIQTNQVVSRAMINTATTRVADNKTSKDIQNKDDDESKVSQDNLLKLTDEAKKAMATQAGGAQSSKENKKQEKSRKKEGTGKAQMFGGEGKIADEEMGKESLNQVLSKDGIQEVSVQNSALSGILDKNPEKVLADVPEGIASAAKNIVNQKLSNAKETKELRSIKPAPDTAGIEMTPAENVIIADIRDASNDGIKPMVHDFEAELQAS